MKKIIFAASLLALTTQAHAFNLFDLGEIEGLGKIGENIRTVSRSLEAAGIDTGTPDAGRINRGVGHWNTMRSKHGTGLPDKVQDWRLLGSYVKGIFR